MGLFGDILALPVQLINTPIRALENIIDGSDSCNEDDRVFSKPLDAIAHELKKIDN